MMSEPTEIESESSRQPQWTVLSRNERRVLGVLVEKAKTTPANYPLSQNALRNGCNQKSNRFPQIELEERHVDDALEDLRKRQAVTFIQGDSRVEKYRHLAYDWLGVDKVELAVMAELLLRGAQSIGELRGRAARMEPIKGMTELTPVLDSLMQKNLVIYLTPPGRGAVVTHNLYQPQELEKVRRDYGGSTAVATADDTKPPLAAPSNPPSSGAMGLPPGAHQAVGPVAGPVAGPAASHAAGPSAETGPAVGDLQAEITALRVEMQDQMAELRTELESLRQQLGG